jgi:hypothetical protein
MRADEKAKTFHDYFSRPDGFDPELYSDDLLRPAGSDTHVRKYQNLYADCFAHHHQVYLDTDPVLTILQNDERRFISADSLDSYFIDYLYTPPEIFESPNSDYTDTPPVPYEHFIKSISDSPVTKTSTSEMPGTNRLTFLIGEVGSGKSLFLSKVIRDLIKAQKLVQSEYSPLVFPIYFDFEKQMKDPEGKLLPIDDLWYEKLCNTFLKDIQRFDMYRKRSKDVIATSRHDHGNWQCQFTAMIRSASESGLLPLLFLDNIDGYHYYFSKYTFFTEFRALQKQSVFDSIGKLSTALVSSDELGLLGMSIVIAARRYVYKECLSTIEPEASQHYSGEVYQLGPVDEVDVISSRMTLLDKAIEVLESDPKFWAVKEDYKLTLNRLRILFGLETWPTVLKHTPDQKTSRVMRTICDLCHHGNRGLVSFLSSLKLDYRENAELIERFFWDKPHSLTLLYIADLKKRYSQAQDHFPNLFLVDAVIQKKVGFESAHQPHAHTYWLKYFLLAYVHARTPGSVTERSLRRVFVDLGGYEDHLFRLALGSLSTSREFSCLEPEPERDAVPRRVKLTSRGRTLLRSVFNTEVRFCFSFNYLQLVVDDYLMSYPRKALNDVYTRTENLGYLFGSSAFFEKANSTYLDKKMHCVTAFIKVLEESYSQEESYRPVLFEHFRQETPSVLVEWHKLVDAVFDEYERILSHHQAKKSVVDKLRSMWRRLEDRGEIRADLRDYFARRPLVEE